MDGWKNPEFQTGRTCRKTMRSCPQIKVIKIQGVSLWRESKGLALQYGIHWDPKVLRHFHLQGTMTHEWMSNSLGMLGQQRGIYHVMVDS
jgi:hypothetical protein